MTSKIFQVVVWLLEEDVSQIFRYKCEEPARHIPKSGKLDEMRKALPKK